MALDPVPWFIGGAAEHSAEAARNIAWNATQGRTGVATPDSLVVSALPTAGGGVRVSPGGAAIESTFAGATQQSYTVRNDATATVDIPANTGSSERHHRVAAYIKDPQYSGSMPSDPANGPYTDWYVGSSWPNWPHVKLAFIRVPPSTSVITNGMIRDERTLLNPRREEVVFGRPRVLGDSSAGSTLTGRHANGGEYFPGGNGSPNQFPVDVPSWATRVMIDADWMGVSYQGGRDVYGNYWVEWGDEYRDRTWPNNQQWEYATQIFAFNSSQDSARQRTNWRLMDAMWIPHKLRGTRCTFAFKGSLSASSETGVSMDHLAGLGMRLTFAEQPETIDQL